MVTIKATPRYSRRIEDYVPAVGREDIEELVRVAKRLKGVSVVHVNSTAYGGGVAEILHSMVPVMSSLGIDARWEVLEAEDEFFQVTKKIHNGLQGNPSLVLTDEDWRTYLKWNQYNAEILDLDADVVLVHDPQPMALPMFKRGARGVWVWRCHIDISSPNASFWEKLSPFLGYYRGVIVHSEEYVKKEFEDRVLVSPPSIDPLSDKNRELGEKEVESVFKRFGVDPERPVITKVARFDPWKDVFSAVDVFREVKKEVPGAQLLLVSSMARDDPEGAVFYEKVLGYVKGEEGVHILTDAIGVRDLEVNAFQRGTTVGLHTAIREGFGLAVTEMLWKKVPVVARPVGGVKKQVVDGVTGFTAWSVQELAERVKALLADNQLRGRLGEAGREHVRRNFVITQHVKRYLSFFGELLGK
ncbi:glycosyltransferase [Thermofilum pendens]|uniref:Glycosyl transferase, group 1 n=1 Tax=Thermofilum pendens (strain DSM 2475 / Hrk 5) TaxID=368408 RepID=A1S0K7_THEPD|nr:glycosyltransferase [Thermofilum pendens]ABL78987.1 glycosyl transferase, group 1 [Thermofilum pendens Hrk 5]